MSRSFDPYREWLGLANGQQGANRYTILGLKPFEDDPETILAAADAAVARVRNAAGAEQAKLRDQVLAQIEAARRCLLDPAARAQYDAKLNSRARRKSTSANDASSGAGETNSAAPNVPRAKPLPKAIPVGRPLLANPNAAGTDGGSGASGTSLSSSLWDDDQAIPETLAASEARTSWRTPIAIGLGFLLAASVLAIGGWFVWQMQDDKLAGTVDGAPPAASQAGEAAAQAADDRPLDDDPSSTALPNQPALEASDPSEDRIVAPTIDVENPSDAPSSGARGADALQSRKMDRAPQAAAKPAVVDPADTDEASTAPANRAESSASPDALSRALNRARGALAARDVALARAQLDQARKLAQRREDRALVQRLELATGHMSRFLAAVRAGIDKLDIVDELKFGDEVVSVVDLGPEKISLRMAGAHHDFTLATLPAPLAVTLAKSVSDSDAGAVLTFLGVFHAVEPGADRSEARRLWQAAAAAGENVDDLLPLIDSDDLTIRREPLPASDVRDEAAERVAREFAATIRGAKTTEQKAFLVRELTSAAAAAEASADQYALLSEACARAALAIDTAGALATIDELARWFEVDPLLLKAEALGKCRAAARDPESSRRVAVAALQLLDESEPPEAVAKSLVLTAVGAARRARNDELLEEAAARRRAIEHGTRALDQ